MVTLYGRTYYDTDPYQETNSWQNTETYTTTMHSDDVLPIVIPVVTIGALLMLIVLLVLLCRCCCCRSRGRVLMPPPLLNEEPPAPAPSMHHTYIIPAYHVAGLSTPTPAAAALTMSATEPLPTAADGGYELRAPDVNALVMAGFLPELQSTDRAAPSEEPATKLSPPTYEQAVSKQ